MIRIAMPKVGFASSTESAIDREIERFVRKIVVDKLSAHELQQLRDLQKRRAYRMQPKVYRQKKRALPRLFDYSTR